MTDQMQVVQLFPEENIRSTIVTIENVNIMVDCGGFVPYPEEVIKAYAERLASVSAVIVTNPSAQYCGALPLLKCLGYQKVIYTAKTIAKSIKLTLEGLRNNFLYDFGQFRPTERPLDELAAVEDKAELAAAAVTSEVVDECCKAEFLLEQEVNTRLQNLHHLPNIILELINSGNESVALVIQHYFYEQKILYASDLALTDNIHQNNFGQNFRKSSAANEQLSLWYFQAPQDFQKIISGPKFAYDRSLSSNIIMFDAKNISDIIKEAEQLNRKIFIFTESEYRLIQYFYLLKQSLGPISYCVHHSKEQESYVKQLQDMLARYKIKIGTQLNQATVVFVLGSYFNSGVARDLLHHFNSPNNIILTLYSNYTAKHSPESLYMKAVLDNRIRSVQKLITVNTMDIKLTAVTTQDQKHKTALEQLADRYRKGQFDIQDCLSNIDFISVQHQLQDYNNDVYNGGVIQDGQKVDQKNYANVNLQNQDQYLSKDVLLWILYKLSKYYEHAVQFTNTLLTENEVIQRPEYDWEISMAKPMPITSGFGYRVPYQSPNLLPKDFDEVMEKILKSICSVLDKKLFIEYIGSIDKQKIVDRFKVTEKTQISYESIIKEVISEYLGVNTSNLANLDSQSGMTNLHQSSEQLGTLQFNSLFKQQQKVQQIVRREILLQKELQATDEGSQRTQRPEAHIKYVPEKLQLQYQHIVVITPQIYMNSSDIIREQFIPEDAHIITIDKSKNKGLKKKFDNAENHEQEGDDNVLNVPEGQIAFLSTPFKFQIQIQLKKRNQDLILDLNGQPFTTKLFGSIEGVLTSPIFLAADRRFLKHKQEEQFRDFNEESVEQFFKAQKHFNQANKRFIKGEVEVTFLNDKNELIIAGKVGAELPRIISELRTDKFIE